MAEDAGTAPGERTKNVSGDKKGTACHGRLHSFTDEISMCAATDPSNCLHAVPCTLEGGPLDVFNPLSISREEPRCVSVNNSCRNSYAEASHGRDGYYTVELAPKGTVYVPW